MQKRILYYHLGYPKTATTTLQKGFFPQIPEVRFLGRYFGLENNTPLFIRELNKYLTFPSARAFDKSIVNIENLLNEEEESRFGNKADDIPILISDEGLFFRTLYPFNIPWVGKFSACPENILSKLKRFADHCEFELKIIITIRNQVDIIHSLYAERYAYYNKIKELNTFPKYLAAALDDKNYYSYGLANLEYNYTLEIIQRIFGKNNCLILKFEDFATEGEKNYNLILNFVSSRQTFERIISSDSEFNKAVNVRSNGSGRKIANYKANSKNDIILKVLKNISVFFLRSARPNYMKKLYKKLILKRSNKSVPIEMTEEQKQIIVSKYQNSNIALAKQYAKFSDYVK